MSPVSDYETEQRSAWEEAQSLAGNGLQAVARELHDSAVAMNEACAPVCGAMRMGNLYGDTPEVGGERLHAPIKRLRTATWAFEALTAQQGVSDVAYLYSATISGRARSTEVTFYCASEDPAELLRAAERFADLGDQVIRVSRVLVNDGSQPLSLVAPPVG